MSSKTMTNTFVPPGELRRLRTGSYEDHTEAMVHDVRDHFKDAPFEIISTQKTSAVIVSEGKFYNVDTAEGTVNVLDVETFNPSNVHIYATRKADKIAGLFIEGKLKTALTHLEDLVMTESLRELTPLSLLEGWLEAPRPWRRLYDTRRESIEAFLGDEIKLVESAQLRLLFEGMYDELIEGDSKRVVRSLEAVMRVLKRMKVETKEATSVIIDQTGKESEGIVEMLARFAFDLFEDLCALCDMGTPLIETTESVADRAKLHDMLVRGIRDRGVASRFVALTASKMVEAS